MGTMKSGPARSRATMFVGRWLEASVEDASKGGENLGGGLWSKITGRGRYEGWATVEVVRWRIGGRTVEVVNLEAVRLRIGCSTYTVEVVRLRVGLGVELGVE